MTSDPKECADSQGIWLPCDDPGSNTTSAPSNVSTTSAGPQTTTQAPQPTPPLSGAAIAAMMNDEYTGFDPKNPSGSIGTYIRITGSTKVWCHEGCYSGYADCRVSGSVYNPTQIVDETTGAIAWSFTGTQTDGDFLGFWVNQTVIKQTLGKCAYIGDGGTDNKYNMGCGKTAACTTNNCTDDTCAFAGMDPATNYKTHITADSDVVAGGMMGGPGCNDPGLCGYKGPAFWKQTGFVQDETFSAWKWRAENPGGGWGWNEYVLDGEELKKALAYNPAGTIPAIVYASTFPGDGKAAAKAMAQAFATEWNMAEPVPVIKIDLTVNVVNGGSPFVFEDTTEELVV